MFVKLNQRIRKVIEFYPELDSLLQENELSDGTLKLLIVQSKRSLRLYTFSRSLKRKITMVKNNPNTQNLQQRMRTFESQIILIKKFASTHQYRSGKKPNANITPTITVDKRMLCWYRNCDKSQLKTTFNELMDY